jgi:hypothetical protein
MAVEVVFWLVVGFVLLGVLGMLILRAFILWYWRINDGLAYLQGIHGALVDLVHKIPTSINILPPFIPEDEPQARRKPKRAVGGQAPAAPADRAQKHQEAADLGAALQRAQEETVAAQAHADQAEAERARLEQTVEQLQARALKMRPPRSPELREARKRLLWAYANFALFAIFLASSATLVVAWLLQG